MSTKLPQFLVDPNPEIYRGKNYVVLDFETTGKDKGDALNPDNDIIMAVWHVVDEQGGIIGKWRIANETLQKELVEDIRAADFLVAHNAKFELQWLHRCGLDLHDVLVYDTQVAEYVLAGNRHTALDLNSCCNRRGVKAKDSMVSKLIKGGIDPTYIPTRWLLKYCKQDVLSTHELFLQHLKLLDEKKLAIVYNRCLVTPCLADIERNGATLDSERVLKKYNETCRELGEVEEELTELSDGINLNSNHQLAKWLYGSLKFKELRKYGKIDRNEPNKQFPNGMPKTDIGTITRLKAKTKKQTRAKELLLAHSKLSAKINKNLRFFKAVCETQDSKFYPIFNQTVTKTHRLSSSGRRITFEEDGKQLQAGCQFQNFPREMKPLFCASGKDRLIGEKDWSQLEFRIAGHLGRDEQIYEDVVHDRDIHQVTADTLTEAGEPTTRQDAKASTFRPLFAGRSGSPAVVEYCDFFRDKYDGISSEQLRWGQQALETGKVETEWGFTFYFPGTKVRPDGTYTNFTNICNYPIQSFSGADINLVAMVHFWHLSKDYDFRIINTIHDSIITDFPHDEYQEYLHLSVQSMLVYTPAFIHKLYGIELYVPLGCEIKMGNHWNEPMELQDIPDDVSGFLTRSKGGNTELQFDQHRTV